MKTSKQLLLLLCIFSLGFGCKPKELSDDEAKQTVQRLLDKSAGITLQEWQGLVKVSDTEMTGRAELNCGSYNGGKHPHIAFTFHKDVNNQWVLDKMNDIDNVYSEDIFRWIRQSLYEKVNP